jgi:Ca-activated chloride channel family protein
VQADAVRDTASALLDRLEAQDQVVVAPFSRGITSVTGPTADRQTILDALRRVRHSGGTAILDSVGQAAKALNVPDRRKAIVLITDGYDEHSESEFDAAIASLRANDTRLYVVGVGGIAGISLKGEKLLSELAAETGGRAWFPRSGRHLAQAYAAIATDVQHNYFLAYTPTNQRRDGTWRAIDVTVNRPDVTIRARRGYTAPTPPPVRASIEFTAVGGGNVPVTLAAEDLVVVENGVEQSVDAFHDAVQPVTIMLALDTSGSMKRSAQAAQDAARQFVTAMRPEDRLGMILFADKADYVHAPTEKRDQSLKAIDGYVASGGTALYDAMHDALEQTARVEGRRVVVIVTDGRDENAASDGPGSFQSWESVLRLVKDTDAAVYAVGLGSRVDRDRLQRLADASGGAAYFPKDVTTLAGDYAKILDELRRRYVIGYQSTDSSRDGAWRTVEIQSRRGGVHMRSRGGYYAPAQ